jgi:hypothetical protein
VERIRRQCEEVHAYGGVAERTGVLVELKGLKARPNACSSMVDLVRKYKLFGDGLFYIPVGLWPAGETSVVLDNIKWMGVEKAFRSRTPRGPRRRRSEDDE